MSTPCPTPPAPLYCLVLVQGFGIEGLRLVNHKHYNSKGQCEVDLEQLLNDARTHGGLAREGVRFGGACVLMEKA